MQLFHVLSLAVLSTAVSGVTVSFDAGYDLRDRSLTKVACSDGPNGLMTRKNWLVQGDVPIFPNIGGAAAISGWNSPNCGTCWRLEYGGHSVTVMAIDHADAGFNIGEGAMNKLTNNQARQLGRVEAKVTQLDSKECGL